MTDKSIIVYVGPHRSGSQFLQTHIFPHVPNLHALVAHDHVINDIPMGAMDEHPLFFDPAPMREKIDRKLETVAEDNVLFSNEELFGDYGKYGSNGIYVAQPFHDSRNRIEVLSKLFDRPKIIMTPRRQDLWIESAYMHFIHNFETVRRRDFVNPGLLSGPTLFGSRSKKPSVDYKSLDWSLYVAEYRRVFGDENVLVLPHEMVLHDLREALERLYGFLKVEPYFPETVPYINKSYSASALKIALVLNRFVKTPQNPCGILPIQPFSEAIMRRRLEKDSRLLWFLAGIVRRISLYWFLNEVVGGFKYRKPDVLGDGLRQTIREYYADRNRAYARLIDIDLQKYGYY